MRNHLHGPGQIVSISSAFGTDHFAGRFFTSQAVDGHKNGFLLPFDHMDSSLGRVTFPIMSQGAICFTGSAT